LECIKKESLVLFYNNRTKMNLLKTTLRIIRAPNIIIIGLTCYFLRFCLFSAAYKLYHIDFFLNDLQFAFLTMAIILVTIGGYIINDIYDSTIDKINYPEKQYLGNQLSEKSTIMVYILVNIIGLILSFIVAYQINYLQWLFFYPLAVLLLWYYSYKLKKTVLFGNLLVALFCSLVVLLLWFSEKESMEILHNSNGEKYFEIISIIIFYSLFAFISTLFREIIKDVEDIEGDKSDNCNTLPVRLGITRTKIITIITGLLLAVLVGIFLFINNNSQNIWKTLYAIIFLIIPVLITLFMLSRADNRQDFRRINLYVKLIMFLGLLYLPILSFF